MAGTEMTKGVGSVPAEWPMDRLESLGRCPVCEAEQRTCLYAGLRDDIFQTAAGEWTMWRCDVCGSAYLDPRPDEKSIHAAYDVYYTHGDCEPSAPQSSRRPTIVTQLASGYRNAEYGLHLRALPTGAIVVRLVPPVRRAIDLSFRYVPPLVPGSPTRVLDVGCGDGRWLAWLRDAGWEVAGVEPDPVAQREATRRGLNVRLGGIEAWNDGTKFDAITMSHVIEHLHHPLDVLKHARNMLKPGGRLFVETPNIGALGHRFYHRHWRGLEPPRHLVVFSRSALTYALREAGFEGIRFRTRQSPLPVLGLVSAMSAAGIRDFDNPPSWIKGPGLGLRLRSTFSRKHAEFLTVTCNVPK